MMRPSSVADGAPGRTLPPPAPQEPVSRFAHLTQAELLAKLKDANWRLRNLYWIMDKEGHTVLFDPWPEQQKFLDNLWWRNIVPKARQRGFSTVVQLMILDACIFNNNISAAIIAQDDDTAGQIFRKKIMFAWERMDPIIRKLFPTKYATKTEISWHHGSTMIVSTSTRGNTLQYLHVSEYGVLCAKYPERAAEIQQGAFPSAQAGIIIIESTVKTPYGIFSDMVRQAQRTMESGKTLSRLEYKLHFASWWDAPEYTMDPAGVTITSEHHAYFHRVEADIGREIPLDRRAWYVATLENDFAGDEEKMWSEYPSTLEEAFKVSTEGLWLAKQMSRARTDRRIGRLPWRPELPVNTFWDLGVDDDTAIWFHQVVGPWNHWIRFIEGSNEPPSYFVKEMNKHGYVWGRHFLPHDGDKRHPGAEQLHTTKDMLEQLGLRNIEIVPRIADIVTGIDQMRESFATYRFDAITCKQGLQHLDGFAKVWNPNPGIWSPIMAKNGHQHAADALRQHGQYQHLLLGGSGKGNKRTVKHGGRVS